MKKLLFIISLVSVCAFSLKAQKWDYQWPLGYDAEIPGVPDIGMLDFNSQLVKVDTFLQDVINFGIGASGSFVCDKETGQVILMTNGCRVYDDEFNIVTGSDTLSPGSSYFNYCINGNNYPVKQSTIILPELLNDSIFYVLHKDEMISSVFQDAVSNNFYLTTIVQKSDASFQMVSKRHLLSIPIGVGKVTACVNHDGTKWWTWVVGYDTNVFYKFLVGGIDTIQGPFVQEVGGVLYNKLLDIGQAAFSPDTKTLAMNADDKKVKVYDFDNETGELSNFREIAYPDDGDYARGLVFSPNSRFIYVTSVSNLYQIDLQDNSVDHIAYHLSVDEDNWPVTIGYMLNGPDCRVYLDAGSTTYYIHAIHQPNEKGLNCLFQARALRLPANQNHEFPNLPMYRFDGACDSSIVFPVSAVGEAMAMGGDVIMVYPNPVASELNIQLSSFSKSEWASIKIFNAYGKLVKYVKEIDSDSFSISVEDFVPGIYFLQYLEAGEVRAVEKLIVQR